MRYFLVLLFFLLFGCQSSPNAVVEFVDTSAVDRVKDGVPFETFVELKSELLKKDQNEVSVLDRVNITIEGPNDLDTLEITVRSQRAGDERGIVPENPKMPEGITQDDLGRFTVTVKPQKDSAGIFAEVPRFLNTDFIYLEVQGPEKSYAATRKAVLRPGSLPSFKVITTKERNKWSLSIQ